MQYNQPYGEADPNASYKDRNTAAGEAGSKVPAAAIEHPQREIMAVIAGAGLSGSKNDLTQLLQAIQQLISQATGGGDTENFVLMPAARSRLPIFPEVLTADGRIPVVSPSAGQVRIPAGYDFLHRGIFNITTVQADFATAATKTYHLRWNPSEGFALKDLGDAAYNPAAKAEGDVIFDSTLDNMLVARVVTNGSNVPTVTNLANKDRFSLSGVAAQEIDSPYQDNTLPSAISNGRTIPFNLARKPRAAVTALNDLDTTRVGQTEVNFGVRVNNRYNALVWYQNNATEQTQAASMAYEVWL